MPASPLHTWAGQRARELRRALTPAEQTLWLHLRGQRLAGFKFRRQEPVGRYIMDFVCFQARLVIELDGQQHATEQAEHDAVRDQWLQDQGFQVLRVWNHEWLAQPEAVLERIEALLRASQACPPHPNPSPTRGKGL